MRLAELQEALVAACDVPITVPYHVATRVHFLLRGEEPVYVDVSLELGDDTISGNGVVLTEGRVIDARLKGTPRDLESRTERGPTVHVTTWSRKRLERLAIHRGDDIRMNDDYDWSRDYGDQWPGLGQLSLHYGAGLDELRLPLAPLIDASRREAFARLVPSLVEDLG